MPVGIVAAGTATAGGSAAGGGAAAGTAAAGGTTVSSASAGASAGAASGTSAGASAGAGAGANAVALKNGQAVQNATSQKFSRSRNVIKDTRDGEKHLTRSANKLTAKEQKEQNPNESISKTLLRDSKKATLMSLGGVVAIKILAPILIPIFIFSLLVNSIYYVTPLSLFDWSYDETMDISDDDDTNTSFLLGISNLIKNDTEETSNGKILAKDLVKLYKWTNLAIDTLNPDEIEYLHSYSNFVDVMIIFSMLQATDPSLTDEPTYVFNVDVDESQSDKGAWDKLIGSFKKLLGFINVFRKNVETKKNATKLLREVYKEMFYYKFKIKLLPLGGTYIKVKIYNKDIRDYIDEHDLSEDQIAMIEDAMNEEFWNDECDNDYSEYHKIAYRQGNGSYYYTNNDGTTVSVNSSVITEAGYGTEKIPESRQSFVNEIAAAAIKEYRRNANNKKILPSVVVAQACYESGWGESFNARYRHNIFGIKQDGQNATFDSWTDCINYYFSKKLIYKSIYSGAWNNDDPNDSLNMIIQGGYCQEDEDYVTNCTAIINTYGFIYFDEVAKGNIESGTQIGDAAVQFAVNHIGMRYSQDERAKDGETVFDCSSFVWYAYKYAGLSIYSDSYPANSRTEYVWLKNQGCTIYSRKDGDSISSVTLEPGDLMFYSTDHNEEYEKKIHHVDIYIGNGQRISAEGKNYGVIQDSINTTRIDVIMRPSMASCLHDSE